jgi:flagellar protein FliO/FliZ
MDAMVYVRFVLSLILVLGLLLGALWAVRRYGIGIGGMQMSRSGARRRLALVEVMPMDAKHKLVLVRRDDREHLLVLGPDAPVVVERDIAQPRFEPEIPK